jgi:hypothetical protein
LQRIAGLGRLGIYDLIESRSSNLGFPWPSYHAPPLYGDEFLKFGFDVDGFLMNTALGSAGKSRTSAETREVLTI